MLVIIFITLAGIFNAIMDLVGGKYELTLFSLYPKWHQFMNAAVSSLNKYKNYDRSQGSRFPFSTKFLVFLTDMWHLAKTLMLLCFALAITTYQPMFGLVIDTLGLWIYFGTVFTIFYDYILRKDFWGIK